MSSATRLFLLRHAEVEEAYQRVFGGRIDMGLSPKGHVQAQELADFLQHVEVSAVYASPMKRVAQTLEPFLKSNGHKAVTVDDLREVDFGAWTGLGWDEVRLKFGVSAYEWLVQLERDAIPGAEPPSSYRARVVKVLERILKEHEGRTVAVFSHGGIIRFVLGELFGLPMERLGAFDISYASVTVTEHLNGRAELRIMNFTPWRRAD
jgi:broad specificity phosphatase PhoE